MTKQELIIVISQNVKLLRAEYNYSQQVMANAIGLSKKTLIQIEKDRLLLSWTAACAVCAIFSNSKLLRMTLGENPTDIAETIAHEFCYEYDEQQNRNYLFWDVIQDDGNYSIQKNIISEHYKIVYKDGKKLFSSFDINKINLTYNDYIMKGNK